MVEKQILLVGRSAVAQEPGEGTRYGLYRSNIGLASRRCGWVFHRGALRRPYRHCWLWHGYLGNGAVYRYGKCAMAALLKYLKGVAVRGLDVFGRAARRYLAGIAIGAWFGSGVGIAAFGTAISGMVPGAILGFLSTWLVYRYGKRR
jgi:hypothetical protein